MELGTQRRSEVAERLGVEVYVSREDLEALMGALGMIEINCYVLKDLSMLQDAIIVL